jgi:hypothetical protein
VPVGTAAAPFTAEFNGNGHAIRNIRLTEVDGVTSYGLFGVTDGAAFISIRIEKPVVSVTPTNRNVSVGTLAGNLSNGYARFIYVTGAEILTSTLSQAGGLFGRADRSTLVEAQFSGEVFVATQINDVGNIASSAGIAGRASWTVFESVSARGGIRGPRAAGLGETGEGTGPLDAEAVAVGHARLPHARGGAQAHLLRVAVGMVDPRDGLAGIEPCRIPAGEHRVGWRLHGRIAECDCDESGV